MRTIDADELDRMKRPILKGPDTPEKIYSTGWNAAIDAIKDEVPTIYPEEFKEVFKPLVLKVLELLPDLTDGIIKALPEIIEQMNYCKTCGLKDYFNGED